MPQSRNILIVDDDARLRDVFATGLQLRGYQVRAVADARAALRELQGFAADLVITDLQMPGANGAALIQYLRDHGSGCKILMVTGGGLPDAPQSGRPDPAYGADAAMRKPVRIHHLDAKIRELLP